MADQFSSKKKRSKRNGMCYLIIIVSVFFVAWPFITWGILYIADRLFEGIDFPETSRFGISGDMYGGLNAWFAGLAFAGLVYTIFKQREDFNEQISEIRKDRMEAMVISYSELISDSIKNLYVLYDMIGINKPDSKGIDVLKDYQKHVFTIKSWFEGDIKRKPTDEEILNETMLISHYSVIMNPVACIYYSALNKMICTIEDFQWDEDYRNSLKKDLVMIISIIHPAFWPLLYLLLSINYSKENADKIFSYVPDATNILKDDFLEEYINIWKTGGVDNAFDYIKSNIKIHH